MRSNYRTPSAAMALGGVLAALAVVIMALGTLIPVATYVCPAICCILCRVVARTCGNRIAWAWYGAVTILSILMAPDKEAALVFAFLGYYPIVKPKLDRLRFPIFWKGLLFNGVIGLLYGILIHLLGMADIAAEYTGMGLVLTAVMLILGNVTFFMLDRLLGMRLKRKR